MPKVVVSSPEKLAREKARYAANPEPKKEYNRRYAKRNRFQRASWARDYYDRNRARILEKRRIRHAANKDRINAARRAKHAADKAALPTTSTRKKP